MSQGKHVNMTEAAEEYYTFVFFILFYFIFEIRRDVPP
jgi:hypothetical protein